MTRDLPGVPKWAGFYLLPELDVRTPEGLEFLRDDLQRFVLNPEKHSHRLLNSCGSYTFLAEGRALAANEGPQTLQVVSKFEIRPVFVAPGSVRLNWCAMLAFEASTGDGEGMRVIDADLYDRVVPVEGWAIADLLTGAASRLRVVDLKGQPLEVCCGSDCTPWPVPWHISTRAKYEA